MNLPQQLLEHKTMMVAILLLARRIAQELEVDLCRPLAEICRTVGANRTSVYEQLGRLLQPLRELAAARPGRPLTETRADGGEHELALLRLTIEVLDYRLRHPGSVVEHRDRTHYQPAFRRFILERKDRSEATLHSFAQAVRVPLDTLRDWLRQDRPQALEPEKKRPPLPVNASKLTREIVDEWERWVGPARAFIGYAHQRFNISTALITRLMKVLGLISVRPRKPPRFRGATLPLSPGTMLVTDGKWLKVRLLDSQQTVYFNWQGIVDQTTACDTATVITDQEDAAAVREAYDRSLEFLGGVVPEALLHDTKPCYHDAHLRQHLNHTGTHMLPATSGRAENKAVLEGAFALWEQRVGTIHLDDADHDSLIRSAVGEIVRAHTAATNAVPRIEFDGRSRLRVLQQYCPTDEQRQRDQAVLARLKADHPRPRSRTPQPNPEALALIEHVFQHNQLLSHDPKGQLRRHLATFDPAAIRRAGAILAAKLQHSQVDHRYAHRYLAKLIRNLQDEIELERAAKELLELSRRQNQYWIEREVEEFDTLASDRQQLQDLALAVAERAAFGGIPLQATFWSRKLLELLRNQAADLVTAVKNHLIRLYEAPKQHRLALLDLITAQQLELV
jgi:hypothetical protein